MVGGVYEALAVIRRAPQRIVLRGSGNGVREAYRRLHNLSARRLKDWLSDQAKTA
jgi:hypothetical protein